MTNIRCKLCGEHLFRPGDDDDRCDNCRRRAEYYIGKAVTGRWNEWDIDTDQFDSKTDAIIARNTNRPDDAVINGNCEVVSRPITGIYSL